MIEIFNSTSGEKIGMLTEDQLDELIDHLSDGSGSERYQIDRDALEFLREAGVDKKVVTMLEKALGSSKQLTIEYHIQDEVDIEFGAEEE